MTAFGTRSRPAQKVPRSLAFCICVVRTSEAWAACRAAASSRRPSALSTRMPVAASSTYVARSPSWSWARRDSTRYRRSKRVQSTTTGRKTHPVSRPSHQFSRISSAMTAMKVTTLVMKKTMPNPANRRIADRSVVARDSSWPDCHSSWNPACSRCRCA